MLHAGRIADRLAQTDGDPATRLLITPQPNLDELRTRASASVDLRLGTWFLIPRPRRTSLLDVRERDARDLDERFAKTYYVPFGKPFFLHPRNFVLAATLEWLRLPHDLAGYVVGRSSWGRHGLNIATATGVHPLFTGCLTLELTNVGEVPIAIYPGLQICQLFLHEVSTAAASQGAIRRYECRTRPYLGSIQPDPIAARLLDPPDPATLAP